MLSADDATVSLARLAQYAVPAAFVMLAARDLVRKDSDPRLAIESGMRWGGLLLFVGLLGTLAAFITGVAHGLKLSQMLGVVGGMLTHILTGGLGTAIILAGWLHWRHCGGVARLPETLRDPKGLRRRDNTRDWGLEMAGLALTMFLFTAVWLRLAARWFDARAGSAVAQMLENEDPGIQAVATLRVLVLIVLAPFIEEVWFRGYGLDRLAAALRRHTKRLTTPCAIVLMAAVFAVLHQGQIDPDWVKWLQIVFVGIVLGYARVRLGLAGAIALHLIYNLLGAVVVPPELLK